MLKNYNNLKGWRRYDSSSILAILFILCGSIFYSCTEAPTSRTLGGAPGTGKRFAQKECLDCHKNFVDQYLTMQNIHPGVKETRCEDCHIRHGLIPKLILKKDGNELCYSCHSKEKIGLDKKNIHTALKNAKCITCHNPHASKVKYLLKAEGKELCYQCHKKDDFEKKVIHKVLQTDGCMICHNSHSSDEKNLLKKDQTALCLTCHEGSNPDFKRNMVITL